MTVPLPVPGRVYRLQDTDWRYGVGPLVARVTKVVRQVKYGNEPWWEVSAVCKPPDYSGPGTERELYVRAGALRQLKECDG